MISTCREPILTYFPVFIFSTFVRKLEPIKIPLVSWHLIEHSPCFLQCISSEQSVPNWILGYFKILPALIFESSKIIMASISELTWWTLGSSDGIDKHLHEFLPLEPLPLLYQCIWAKLHQSSENTILLLIAHIWLLGIWPFYLKRPGFLEGEPESLYHRDSTWISSYHIQNSFQLDITDIQWWKPLHGFNYYITQRVVVWNQSTSPLG